MAGISIRKRDGTVMTLSWETVAGLRSALRGNLVTGNDPDYETIRRVWNGSIDRKPALIVRCQGAADVMATVNFVRTHDLAVSIRSGGHNVSGASIAEAGLVIDVSLMRGVHVNPAQRTAFVEAGALLGDLDHETTAFGLAAPVGVVSATGVTGLTLHGGVGWLLRKHGMSIDNLLAAHIVTADGQLLRASPESYPDLFWALRGGGGNFGVVTALEFQLHPVNPEVFWMMPMYPLAAAKSVIGTVQDHMKAGYEDLMVVAAFGSVPPMPEVEATAHGEPAVILLGCYSGDPQRAEAVTGPLRTAAKPITDLSTAVSWVQVQQMLDEDYPDGKLYYWSSIYLDELNDQVVSVLEDYTRRRPSLDTTIDIWFLGGAMAKVSQDATAFFHRQHPFMIGIEANWDDEAASQANIQWARSLHKALEPLAAGGRYLNFPGHVDQQEAMLRNVFADNLERLRKTKQTYDPKGLFPGLLNIAAGD